MASQRDFPEQKRWLQELLKYVHQVYFYPKFFCELNYIKRFLCAVKFEPVSIVAIPLRAKIYAVLDPVRIWRRRYIATTVCVFSMRTVKAYHTVRRSLWKFVKVIGKLCST